MGLDMYAFSVDPKNALGTFSIRMIPEDNSHRFSVYALEDPELCYWRGHHDLHLFMYWQAVNKGLDLTSFSEFNMVPVQLDESDLTRLENFMKTTDYRDRAFTQQDTGFLRDARESLRRGLCVYYTSSW